MAFSQAELIEYRNAMDDFMASHRPKEEIRDQVDLGYRIEGQSIEIFEIRPNWMHPEKKTKTPVAKATYVRTQDLWRVFWQMADLEWHGYPPRPRVGSLPEFLGVVHSDEHGCFWG